MNVGELPDLDMMIAKAVPFEDKDCHIERGRKEHKRKRLKAEILEYAEIFHIKRLNESR